ncbi:MAG TPA: LysE family translocator [Terriglobales bacterium]|nr:LysE family translocator [Terriglobales bacterium]
MEASWFLAFLATALVLLLTPGPAVLYIAARSVEQGVRAGLVAAAGMCAGGLVHVLAAACGLAALLAASDTAFGLITFAGAAYLVYLGIRTLKNAASAAEPAAAEIKPLRRIFSESVFVQVLNPKTALFFFAFLPQFIEPERGSAFGQALGLGIVFVTLALITDSGYALFAGQFRAWLRSTTAMLKVQRYLAGVVYIALGVVTAVSSL